MIENTKETKVNINSLQLVHYETSRTIHLPRRTNNNRWQEQKRHTKVNCSNFKSIWNNEQDTESGKFTKKTKKNI